MCRLPLTTSTIVPRLASFHGWYWRTCGNSLMNFWTSRWYTATLGIFVGVYSEW